MSLLMEFSIVKVLGAAVVFTAASDLASAFVVAAYSSNPCALLVIFL